MSLQPSLLIELSEQMEQQGATRWTEGQIAQLIKDDPDLNLKLADKLSHWADSSILQRDDRK